MAGRHQVLHWRHNGRNNVIDQEGRISPFPPSMNSKFISMSARSGQPSSPPTISRPVCFVTPYGLLILRHDRRRILWLGLPRTLTSPSMTTRLVIQCRA